MKFTSPINCGFCQELKKRYGVKGQITVTYDMTFLILLLKGLYEVEDKVDGCKCIAHPFGPSSDKSKYVYGVCC